VRRGKHLNLLDRACFSSEELPTVIERVGRWAGSTSVAHSRADAFRLNSRMRPPLADGLIRLPERQLRGGTRASFLSCIQECNEEACSLVLRVTESAQPVFIVVVGCVGKTVVAVGRDLKRRVRWIAKLSVICSI